MNVSIVSPEEKVWEGEADLVIARSPEGEFGIMRGHIPFLAALVPGVVGVVSGNDREEYFVPGGFLEASGPADDYHVIVLADNAELLGDIDVAEAKRNFEEARKRAEDQEDDRSEAALRVEMARVEIAESRGQ
ncbi:MAG TPA: ATP synthase F1 subunit epsilon [Actinomycetota bacterium]|nr:ATP synthase F1 subunit epsilon [Actinomycetota bacterium]